MVNHFLVRAFAPLWTAAVVICSDNSVCLNHWTQSPPLALLLYVAWLIDKVKALCCPARICLCFCCSRWPMLFFFSKPFWPAGTHSQTCWAKVSHSIMGGHQQASTYSLNLVLPSPVIIDTNIRKPKSLTCWAKAVTCTCLLYRRSRLTGL